MGRYHHYRLHPFTLAELNSKNNTPSIMKEIAIPDKQDFDALGMLDVFGGFPEPLMKQTQRTLRRWHNEKNNRLFREDIRDIEQIRDLSSMQLLGDMLPERAASLLSVNSLREDLGVSHRAVSSWLNILESFYYCFRVYPYSGKNYRSLKKEAKLYLWDWSEIDDEAARFENLIASHLLKLVHYLQDYEGYKARLNYLRSIEKKEVDFLISVGSIPWFAVEVKLNNISVSRNLHYFNEKLHIPFLYQVVKKSSIDTFTHGARVVSADKFLGGLI